MGDINQVTAGSNPRQFAELAGRFYFVSEIPGESPRLWTADPATGVVAPVAYAGGDGLWSPDSFAVVGQRLFFRAHDPVHGSSIFEVDAAAPGSLNRVNLPYWYYPGGLTACAGSLFFQGYGTDSNGYGAGYELMRLDPETGQITTYDLYPGSSSSPSALSELNGKLFFIAYGNGTGNELWCFDPSSDVAPRLLRDIYPGWNSSSIGNLRSSGTKLYFTANDGSTEEELWVSDGTAAGTHRVDDINQNTSGSSPSQLMRSGDKLYFTAWSEASGWELYRANPADGTVQQLEIRPGPNDGSPGGNSGGFADLNGTLYFSGYDDANGWELWRVSAEGTPERLDLGRSQATPQSLLVVDGTLYFTAEGEANADGYPNRPDLSRTLSLNGEAVTLSFEFLRLDTWDQEAFQLFIDKTQVFSQPFMWYGASPEPLTGSTGDFSWSITPITGNDRDLGFYGYNDQIFRVTVSIPQGFESIQLGLRSTLDENIDNESFGIRNLEVRSSASPNTLLLSDPGNDPSLWSNGKIENAEGLGTFLGRYSNDSLTYRGREIWRIDNTTGEPVVIDLANGGNSSYPWRLQSVGGKLFFTAYTPETGYELWKLDPADHIPHLVADIYPGGDSSRNSYDYWWDSSKNDTVIQAGGRTYFVANNGSNGRELYRIEPEGGGAVLLEISPNGEASPKAFTVSGDRLFFLASDDTRRGLYGINVASGLPERFSIPGLTGYNEANISNLFEAFGRIFFLHLGHIFNQLFHDFAIMAKLNV